MRREARSHAKLQRIFTALLIDLVADNHFVAYSHMPEVTEQKQAK